MVDDRGHQAVEHAPRRELFFYIGAGTLVEGGQPVLEFGGVMNSFLRNNH